MAKTAGLHLYPASYSKHPSEGAAPRLGATSQHSSYLHVSRPDPALPIRGLQNGNGCKPTFL